MFITRSLIAAIALSVCPAPSVPTRTQAPQAPASTCPIPSDSVSVSGECWNETVIREPAPVAPLITLPVECAS